MSKYADIEQIKKTIREEWVKYIPMEFDMNISFVLGKIAEVPTIDIVRCKDCTFAKPTKTENVIQCARLSGYAFRINHYCSVGERKDEQ